MFRDFFYFGYQKGEYKLRSVNELRGAKNAFMSQIKVVTLFSLALCALEIVFITWVILNSSVKEFAKNWYLHIEIGIVLLVFIFTLTSIKSKKTTIIQVVLYGISTILTVLFGNAGSVFMCLLGMLLYVRLVFTHTHLGYINERGDVGDVDKIREIICGTNDMRNDLKKVFDDFENGGINPFNGQKNHEYVFEAEIDKLKKAEDTAEEGFASIGASQQDIEKILDKMANNEQQDNPDWL